MLRSLDERLDTDDRAAVEPIAALVAVLAVGAALALYVGALDDVGSDATEASHETGVAVDRIERELTGGGVVRPDRLSDLDETRHPATVELEADGDGWQRGLGGGKATATQSDHRSAAVVERQVTVRVAPGRNVAGTLRVVFHE